MSRISVVIPTFNRQQYLNETIKSLSNQTVKPFEVIIVDNGTEISSVNEINLNINFFRTVPNIGVSQARNFGLSVAKGDYVAFLDDDDLYESNVIETVCQEIELFNPDIILLKMKSYETNFEVQSKSMDLKSNNLLKKTILKKNPGIVGSSTIINRNLLLDSNFSPYDPFLLTGEDKAFVLDLLLNNNEIKIVRSGSYFLYRNHASSNRQSTIKKLTQGKRSFYKKYKRHMTFIEKFYNHINLLRLLIMSKLKK